MPIPNDWLPTDDEAYSIRKHDPDDIAEFYALKAARKALEWAEATAGVTASTQMDAWRMIRAKLKELEE